MSSLKRAKVPTDSLTVDDGLAIEAGTFKWNEVPEEVKDTENGKKSAKSNSSTSHSRNTTDETVTAVDAQSLSSRSVEDHKFELKDVSVRFPLGELTLITGPTASGKSALLVSRWVRESL